jgi:outer membrane immunogenic protein
MPPPPRAPATYVPVAVPYYNWGGIYFGVNGGYAHGRTNWSGAQSTGTFNASGFLVGGTLGANFQAGAFVFGVEGDLDYASLSGSATCVPAGVSCQTSENYLGTARLRAGYAWGRVLFYATGAVPSAT